MNDTGERPLAPVTSLGAWRRASRSGTSDERATEIVAPASRRVLVDAAEQRALAILRRGDKSREELRLALVGESAGETPGERLDDDEIAALLDRLAELGYLDDVRMAEHLVDRLRERKGLGNAGLRRALRERRLDSEAIDQALAGLDRDDEFARAAELASSRAGRLRGLDHDTAMRRLVGVLQRRGYSQGVAMIAAGEALVASDPGARSARAGRRVAFVETSPDPESGGWRR